MNWKYNIMHTCGICGKEFVSILGLNGHKRVHTSKPKQLKTKCSCIFTRQVVTVGYLEEFQSKLGECKCCGRKMYKAKSFCNSSCSAKYNNVKRAKEGFSLSEESRNKIRSSIRSTRDKKNKQKRMLIFKIPDDAIYSRIYHRKCKHCSEIFMSRRIAKFCGKCNVKYTPIYRNQYKFTFNVYEYPDLFDIDYIKYIGWYSRGGKAGKWNPDGLSRDHKVSVSVAIKNDYDPYYIKHPVNCAIMKWVDNNKKKTRCSITYEQLVKSVDEYDMKHKISK